MKTLEQTTWKPIKGMKGVKTKQVKFTYELPKKLMGHIHWANSEDRNYETLEQNRPMWVDHFTAMDEMDFIMYRAFMWEAGFTGTYAWIQENKSYYDDLLGEWKWNGDEKTMMK